MMVRHLPMKDVCPAVEEVRWDDWEERVEEDRRTRPLSRAARAASTVELRHMTEMPMLESSKISKLDRGFAKDVKKHMET